MARRAHLGWIALMLGAALALQLGLYAAGFYRVSHDESARSLVALSLSWGNALEPSIWPPFYKIFVGLFLRLHDDVFLVPRILSSVAGLLAIIVLVHLADVLFRDRRVALTTGVLAVLAPHRLVFSVAPLSDIYYFLFIIASAACVLVWLKEGRSSRLILGCCFLALAETVRYEACFFAATLLLALLHRLLIRRDMALATAVVASCLLFAFPVFWAVNSHAWYGSLDNLGVTSRQFMAIYGADYGKALRWNPLVRSFRLDLLWSPLTWLGLAVLVRLGLRDAGVRSWALVFGTPLVLISAVVAATLSIPLAAPWRTSGAWALLLLPFNAFALVRLGEWLRQRVRPHGWALAILAAVALLPPAVRSAVYVHDGMLSSETGQWRREREVGVYVRDRLAQLGGGQALTDSFDNLDYLDVLVGSAVPGRFVLTADADPVEVAFHVPMREKYLREGPAQIVDRYLTDDFDLEQGGSAEAFAKRDVRLVLVRNKRFIARLDAAPLVERERTFGDWVVYRVRREAIHLSRASPRPEPARATLP